MKKNILGESNLVINALFAIGKRENLLFKVCIIISDKEFTTCMVDRNENDKRELSYVNDTMNQSYLSDLVNQLVRINQNLKILTKSDEFRL
ncbi:MAG: hypothetical protein HFJ12_06370 [Bacilli bacterium]|nr:hypothetical protein [Bacilli bacterium]